MCIPKLLVSLTLLMCSKLDLILDISVWTCGVIQFVTGLYWCFRSEISIHILILDCLLISTHWGRVTHICVSKLTIIGSDNGLSPERRQAIIWTKAGNIVDLTLRNKLQWNGNRNSYIFIQENPFENVVWKMAAILSRPQCVKIPSPSSLKPAVMIQSVMTTKLLEYEGLCLGVGVGSWEPIHSSCCH